MSKKTKIVKKDGSATPYFWSDKDGKELTEKTVYKQTDRGVTRMKGVKFDVTRKKMNRD
jgi:hypothetical protein